MLVLAVSALEKLRQVPLKNLAILGLVIVVLIGVIFLIKQVAGMNRLIFIIVGGTILVVLLMAWVYQRNEPKFLSPLVDKIAPFFPSAPKPLSGRPDAATRSGQRSRRRNPRRTSRNSRRTSRPPLPGRRFIRPGPFIRVASASVRAQLHRLGVGGNGQQILEGIASFRLSTPERNGARQLLRENAARKVRWSNLTSRCLFHCPRQ